MMAHRFVVLRLFSFLLLLYFSVSVSAFTEIKKLDAIELAVSDALIHNLPEDILVVFDVDHVLTDLAAPELQQPNKYKYRHLFQEHIKSLPVPQEISLDLFQSVGRSVAFSQQLYGHPKDPDLIDQILEKLFLSDKKDQPIGRLSGGMKRRVMIAKALSHKPKILFLDEPSAGLDVELRQSMWGVIRQLKEGGVTIILTTHYLEEAEKLADRIAIIDQGRIILQEKTAALMSRMADKRYVLTLKEKIDSLPLQLEIAGLSLSASGQEILFSPVDHDQENFSQLFHELNTSHIQVASIQSVEKSLEDIFVQLISTQKGF